MKTPPVRNLALSSASEVKTYVSSDTKDVQTPLDIPAKDIEKSGENIEEKGS